MDWKELLSTGNSNTEKALPRNRKVWNTNPFDPQWQDYPAERTIQKKFGITLARAGVEPC